MLGGNLYRNDSIADTHSFCQQRDAHLLQQFGELKYDTPVREVKCDGRIQSAVTRSGLFGAMRLRCLPASLAKRRLDGWGPLCTFGR